MKTLEFFFDFGSPYSYLASTQVEAVAARGGARLEWRPFLIGAVFKAIESVPAALNPRRAPYLLKDLIEWARHYGLEEFTLPIPFPANSLHSCRLALVAAEQGKLPSYAHALYRQIFARGKDQANRDVLSDVLSEVGLDPQASFARAEAAEIKALLRQNTDEALERGAFGAPTFFVGDEMYFGNDRLLFVEQALRKA